MLLNLTCQTSASLKPWCRLCFASGCVDTHRRTRKAMLQSLPDWSTSVKQPLPELPVHKPLHAICSTPCPAVLLWCYHFAAAVELADVRGSVETGKKNKDFVQRLTGHHDRLQIRACTAHMLMAQTAPLCWLLCICGVQCILAAPDCLVSANPFHQCSRPQTLRDWHLLAAPPNKWRQHLDAIWMPLVITLNTILPVSTITAAGLSSQIAMHADKSKSLWRAAAPHRSASRV